MIHSGYCQVTEDTLRYYRELDRLDREEELRIKECLELRDEARRRILSRWGFICEAFCEIEDSGQYAKRIMAALIHGDDADIGAAIRSHISNYLSEILDEVEEGAAHGGRMMNLIKFWESCS